MRVLIIKLTSMGDIIHTLPALSDAAVVHPQIQFDWVADRAFAEIPRWHPHVNQVIESAHRHWKRHVIQSRGAIKQFLGQLRQQQYDVIIDAQSNLKSAVLTRLARGKARCGYDAATVREWGAHWAYQQQFAVSRRMHAITRIRHLFAQSLGYTLSESAPDYNLDVATTSEQSTNYVVFMFATTWQSKYWPLAYWQQLGQLMNQQGYQIQLPWGNEQERTLAQQIAEPLVNACVLPKLTIREVATVLAGATAWAGVDTGLSHLAAALDVPGVSIFGATDPDLSSPMGKAHHALRVRFPCAPCMSRTCTYPGTAAQQPACYTSLDPQRVAVRLQAMIAANSSKINEKRLSMT